MKHLYLLAAFCAVAAAQGQTPITMHSTNSSVPYQWTATEGSSTLTLTTLCVSENEFFDPAHDWTGKAYDLTGATVVDTSTINTVGGHVAMSVPDLAHGLTSSSFLLAAETFGKWFGSPSVNYNDLQTAIHDLEYGRTEASPNTYFANPGTASDLKNVVYIKPDSSYNNQGQGQLYLNDGHHGTHVTTTPEPFTMLLAASGAGLFLRRRARRA